MEITPILAPENTAEDVIKNQKNNDLALALLRRVIENEGEVLLTRLAENLATQDMLLENIEKHMENVPVSCAHMMAYATLTDRIILANLTALQGILEERELNIDTVRLGHSIVHQKIDRTESSLPYPEIPADLNPDPKFEQYKTRFRELSQRHDNQRKKLIRFNELFTSGRFGVQPS